MHSFIEFIMGPMVWISFGICVLGSIFKLFQFIKQVREKENFVFDYLSLKYSLRSIFAWLTPYLPSSTRKSPVFYTISYIFHILIFIVPLFLLSHIALFEESFNWTWPALNDGVADTLSIVVILALLFFAGRRIFIPEVKFLTGTWDYIFIGIVALPFITGVLAYHQIFAYQWMMIIHVISGELVLILIPFSRLFHMFLAPLTRAYTGSEFGAVRHAKDW